MSEFTTLHSRQVPTPEFFRKAREHAGSWEIPGGFLSRREAALRLGIDSETLRRWEVGSGVEADEIDRYLAAYAVLSDRADARYAQCMKFWDAELAAGMGLPEMRPSWRDYPPSWRKRKAPEERQDTLATVLGGYAMAKVYYQVRCDTCGAPPEKPCSTPRGRRTAWHAERRTSAANAMRAVLAIAQGVAERQQAEEPSPADEWADWPAIL